MKYPMHRQLTAALALLLPIVACAKLEELETVEDVLHPTSARSCTQSSECAAGFACVASGCRMPCSEDSDCASSSVCATAGEGGRYCADPSSLDARGTIAPPSSGYGGSYGGYGSDYDAASYGTGAFGDWTAHDAATCSPTDFRVYDAGNLPVNEAGATTSTCLTCTAAACAVELATCGADCDCATQLSTFLTCANAGGGGACFIALRAELLNNSASSAVTNLLTCSLSACEDACGYANPFDPMTSLDGGGGDSSLGDENGDASGVDGDLEAATPAEAGEQP